MTGDLAICVGGFVVHHDCILLVRQTYGDGLANKWTVPWGYAYNPETGMTDTPDEAVVREIREEAGIEARVRSLVGVQNYRTHRGERQLHFLYLCEYVGGTPRPDNRETDAAGFFSASQLDVISNDCDQYCLWLAKRVLNGQYNGLRVSLANPFAKETGFY